MKVVSRQKYLVAGDEDGVIRTWTTKSARWCTAGVCKADLGIGLSLCREAGPSSPIRHAKLHCSICPRLASCGVVCFAPRPTGRSQSSRSKKWSCELGLQGEVTRLMIRVQTASHSRSASSITAHLCWRRRCPSCLRQWQSSSLEPDVMRISEIDRS